MYLKNPDSQGVKKPAQGPVSLGAAGDCGFGGVLSILRNTSSGFCGDTGSVCFTVVGVAGII